MNINPLYLQEVSREYYTKILNNSRQQKAATRLTKKWLAKNPTATKEKALDKFKDISFDVHHRYDKARKRQWDNTMDRTFFINKLADINSKDPKKLADKDALFKKFRNYAKASRQDRLKELDKRKISDDIFKL